MLSSHYRIVTLSCRSPSVFTDLWKASDQGQIEATIAMCNLIKDAISELADSQDIKRANYLIISGTNQGAMQKATANECRHPSAVVRGSSMNPILSGIYMYRGSTVVKCHYLLTLLSLLTHSFTFSSGKYAQCMLFFFAANKCTNHLNCMISYVTDCIWENQTDSSGIPPCERSYNVCHPVAYYSCGMKTTVTSRFQTTRQKVESYEKRSDQTKSSSVIRA